MEPVAAFDIQGHLKNSITDLFDTMLSMALEQEPDVEAGIEGLRIIGSLSFTGDVIGSIHIQVNDSFAGVMAAAMLGMEPDEIESDEQIKDVILEVCNIVGGNLKSALNDAQFRCEITTPSLTIGYSFKIETLNMARYERMVFRHAGQRVIVEVCVKAAADAAPETIRRLTAVDVKKFGKLDIISTAGDSVIELFNTMLSMELEISTAAPPARSDVLQVVGAINFAGDVKGCVSLRVSEPFGRIVASKISDQKWEDVKLEEIKDVIGELCNIVAGNLKSAFCDSGLICEISPPSITTGDDFRIETLNMARYERFALKFFEHDLFVEVCVKINERAPAEASAPQPPTEPEATAPDLQPPTSVQEPLPAAPEKAEALDRISEALSEGISSDKLDVLMSIPVEITVELGRSRKPISEILKYGPGAVIELANLDGQPLDILANDNLIARGTVIVEGEKYGIRVTEIIRRKHRTPAPK